MALSPRRKTANPDVSVPRETLQALFDIACNSMDFGSGFLDQEEAVALRAVAVLLGVDVSTATPFNLWKHFPHPCAPWPYAVPHYDTDNICYVCREVRGNVVHQEA